MKSIILALALLFTSMPILATELVCAMVHHERTWEKTFETFIFNEESKTYLIDGKVEERVKIISTQVEIQFIWGLGDHRVIDKVNRFSGVFSRTVDYNDPAELDVIYQIGKCKPKETALF